MGPESGANSSSSPLPLGTSCERLVDLDRTGINLRVISKLMLTLAARPVGFEMPSSAETAIFREGDDSPAADQQIVAVRSAKQRRQRPGQMP